MCLMQIIGLFAAAAAWQVNPALGLLVAFLFVGGFGWKLIFAALGGLMGDRDGSKAEFIQAWETLHGEMEFGRLSTYPPPGAYETWRQQHKQTGMPASMWILLHAPSN
jgi:hypothetical protein